MSGKYRVPCTRYHILQLTVSISTIPEAQLYICGAWISRPRVGANREESRKGWRAIKRGASFRRGSFYVGALRSKAKKNLISCEMINFVETHICNTTCDTSTARTTSTGCGWPRVGYRAIVPGQQDDFMILFSPAAAAAAAERIGTRYVQFFFLRTLRARVAKIKYSLVLTRVAARS